MNSTNASARAHAIGFALPRIKVSLARLQAVALTSDAMAPVLGGILGEMIFSQHVAVAPDMGRAIGAAAVTALLFILLMKSCSMYALEVLTSQHRQIGRLILFWTAAIVFLGAVAFALKIVPLFPRLFVAGFFVSGLVLVLTGRYALAAYIQRALAEAKIAGPETVLIDCCSDGLTGTTAGELKRHGFHVSKSFEVPRQASREELMRVADSVVKAVRGSDIQQILITTDCETLRFVRPILAGLQSAPLPVRIVMNERTTEFFTVQPQRIGKLSSFEVQRPPLSGTEQAMKRALDLVVASAAVLLLAPLMFIIALLIRLDSPGPALFRQQRNGFNGRGFRILKFRSMTVMEDAGEVRQASREDPRVTRVGRFLRKSSLDELPQLLNVLHGQMSICGPRPHAISHDDYYSREVANYASRHKLKPGITGWAQAHGYRGQTLTVDDMARRIEHDIYYIEHWSLWLDIVILLRTALGLFRSKNAF
jgi:Undecaprenyl-phosphate glucose phosphotransferase